jgi:uncharacterized membrane protein YadS
MYQDQYSTAGVLEAATITKLVRNLMMAAVIPLVALLLRDGARHEGDVAVERRFPVISEFVLWFIAMCALRSAVDFCEPALGPVGKDAWNSIVGGVSLLSIRLLLETT